MASIQGIYIALFGRPADPLGLDFFNEATSDGADLTAIGDLSATAEYQSRFEGKDNASIVTTIYQSLFGRNPEQAGLAFFVNALNSGELNINNVAIAILDGAQGDDLATVNNKIAAADAFTAAIDTPDELAAYRGDAAADAGRAFITPITSDEASIPTAAQTDAAIAAIVDDAPGSGPVGGTFTLTPGDDYADNAGSIKNGGLQPSDFTFTTKNDTVIANAATLQATDILLDNSTTDNDVLKYTGATVTAFDTALAIQNIENFEITLASATNSAAVLTAVTGLKSIEVDGSIAAGQTVQITDFGDTGVTTLDSSGVTAPTTAAIWFTDADADGNITFKGGAANEQVTLGDGKNTIDTGAGSNQVTVGNGDNTITTGAGDDTVSFGNGANTIVLGDGANTVTANGANDGNNTITGGSGVDDITVGNGKNTIVTGAGADDITVGTGANTITAGAGADLVALGAGGVNTLIFAAGDSGASAGAFDIITNFEVSGSGKDILDFAGGAAGTAANLVTSNAGAGGDTFATALAAAQNQFDNDTTTVYFAQDNTVSTWVFADVDGDNVIDFAVQLTGVAAAENLTTGSFA